MTPEQRHLVLEIGENYPLRVTFLGKVGLLSREEMDFLRSHGVDFDVDERQVQEVLARQEQLEPLLQVGQGQEGVPTTVGGKEELALAKAEGRVPQLGREVTSPRRGFGCITWIASITGLGLALVTVVRRAIGSRRRPPEQP